MHDQVSRREGKRMLYHDHVTEDLRRMRQQITGSETGNSLIPSLRMTHQQATGNANYGNVSMEEDRRTLLMFAARFGHSTACRYLLDYGQHLGVKAEQTDLSGRNACFYCIDAGPISNDILAMLLAYGVSQTADLDHGTTPLMYAASHANLVQVKTLLLYADEDTLQKVDVYGENALFYAARTDFPSDDPRSLEYDQIIEALLAAGIRSGLSSVPGSDLCIIPAYLDAQEEGEEVDAADRATDTGTRLARSRHQYRAYGTSPPTDTPHHLGSSSRNFERSRRCNSSLNRSTQRSPRPLNHAHSMPRCHSQPRHVNRQESRGQLYPDNRGDAYDSNIRPFSSMRDSKPAVNPHADRRMTDGRGYGDALGNGVNKSSIHGNQQRRNREQRSVENDHDVKVVQGELVGGKFTSTTDRRGQAVCTYSPRKSALAICLSNGRDVSAETIISSCSHDDLKSAVTGVDDQGHSVVKILTRRKLTHLIHALKSMGIIEKFVEICELTGRDKLGMLLHSKRRPNSKLDNRKSKYLKNIRELLLSKDIDVNRLDRDGKNSVYLAVEGRHPADVLELLLDHGGRQIADSFGRTPAMVVCGDQHICPEHALSLLQTLCSGCLDTRAWTNVKSPNTGRTAFHEAATSGNVQALRFLYSRGCDPNAADDKGRTALMMAAARGHDVAMATLIDSCSACLESADLHGNTAIDLGADKSESRHAGKKLNCTKMVANCSCLVNRRNRSGITALMLACRAGSVSVGGSNSRHAHSPSPPDDSRRTPGSNEYHSPPSYNNTDSQALSKYFTKEKTIDSGSNEAIYSKLLTVQASCVDALKTPAIESRANTSNGISVNMPAKSTTAIVPAAAVQHFEDPWRKEKTPAEMKSEVVNMKLIEFLLDNGADPTIQDNNCSDSFDYIQPLSNKIATLLSNKSTMHADEQRVLVDYRTEILDGLEPASVATDRLLAMGVITPSLRSGITMRHREERAEWLLDSITTRGPNAFRSLVKVLKQGGHEELAFMLMKAAYSLQPEIYI